MGQNQRRRANNKKNKTNKGKVAVGVGVGTSQSPNTEMKQVMRRMPRKGENERNALSLSRFVCGLVGTIQSGFLFPLEWQLGLLGMKRNETTTKTKHTMATTEKESIHETDTSLGSPDNNNNDNNNNTTGIPNDTGDMIDSRLLDDEDVNDPYLRMVGFRSIRDDQELEVAISVQWDGMTTPLHIQTLLEEDELAPLFAGAQWAGTRVWHAAIAMTEFMIRNHANELLGKPKETGGGAESSTTGPVKLLELGCGLGVPGMILHSLYSGDNPQLETFLTDQESILSQLQHNIRQNYPTDENDDDENDDDGGAAAAVVHKNNNKNIKAFSLDWSREATHELLQQVNATTTTPSSSMDIVLNCDCVYEPLYGDSWKLLADVQDELLQMNPLALVLTSVERRNADAIDDYLERLESLPHVSKVEQVWRDDGFRIQIYRAYGQT